MKYNIIFLLMNIFLLISCSAKDRNSDFFKVRDSVNLERQKSLEAAKKLDELIAKESDVNFFDFQNEIEEYEYSLILEVNNKNINVYSEPFSCNSNKLIYTSKSNDKIIISKILYLKKYKKTSLEIKIPSGEIGYIPISVNPFENGNFLYKEIIECNGSKIKILNLNKIYNIECDDNNFANIKKLPFDKSETFGIINQCLDVVVSAITCDYKWIYISYNSCNGWIKTDYICRGIGGPVIMTPEECIKEELLWKGER